MDRSRRGDGTAALQGLREWIDNNMDHNRLAKGNDALYKLLDREIRHKFIEAKENMLTEPCQLIGQLDAANKTNLMHTHIRLATGGKCSNGVSTCIEAKDGTIIMETEKILARWYEYIGDLYNDNRGQSLPQNLYHLSGSRTYLEWDAEEKSLGPDDITTAGMLVAAGDRNI